MHSSSTSSHRSSTSSSSLTFTNICCPHRSSIPTRILFVIIICYILFLWIDRPSNTNNRTTKKSKKNDKSYSSNTIPNIPVSSSTQTSSFFPSTWKSTPDNTEESKLSTSSSTTTTISSSSNNDIPIRSVYENNEADTMQNSKSLLLSSSSTSSSTSVSAGPWLINILLGDPHYQYYIIHSLIQARLFNPGLKMILVVSPEFYINKPEWVLFLSSTLQVNLVNYTMLQSDELTAFALAYRNLWKVLKGKVGFMLPTVKDKMNFEFTQYTMERLYAVYMVMHIYKLDNVLHLENDQMIYYSITKIIEAAHECDLTLAMTRMNREMAPAVVYIRNATALKDMLDFMYESITNGVDHAISVAGTGWVTDMTLTSAYFNRQYKLAQEENNMKAKTIVSFPYEQDSSCLSNALDGLIFDAAPLGHWCCGTFEKPKEYYSHRHKDSLVPYWDFPFVWVNRTLVIQQFTDPYPIETMVTIPEWNSLRVFNLHIHSKQLYLWKSLPYPPIPSYYNPRILDPPPDKVDG